MAHICQVHPYEAAEGLCRSCGGPFCADCLVYPFGPAKPPYCVPCAVAAAGVRRSARNPTVAVPKETKQRLKEWRKARKRDLASPPADGVATWQKMDEAEAADDDSKAEALAAAELEALRLPPPEPETATPPPGVNLAPPGPEGSERGEEFETPLATEDDPPGSSFVHSAASEPDPDVFGIGAGLAVVAPVEEPRWTPPTEDDLPAAVAPTPAVDFEPAPPSGVHEPYTGPAIEPPPFEPPPFAPMPFAPMPFAPDGGAATPPVAGGLAPDSLVPSFDAPAPAIAEPPAAFGPSAGEAGERPLPEPEQPALDPLPPSPPPAGYVSFAPLPPAGPTAFDPLPPPPPPAEHVSFDTPPDAVPVAVGAPVAAGLPPSTIRPPTPTRVPAATSDRAKPDDAKALLARIAALRSDKVD